MRGKRGRAKPYRVTDRITPAGAGKTASSRYAAVGYTDHPRRCGENRPDAAAKPFVAGSPPQVRGKLLKRACSAVGNGITPAGAGKTYNPRTRCYRSRDHPRRCGENVNQCMNKRIRPGSPPQVRGKLCTARNAATETGITPAGAGKTKRNPSVCGGHRDHPRRCGENDYVHSNVLHHVGSPPQVRGKLVVLPYRDRVNGITPAGAGKTMTSRNSISCA